MQLVETLDTCCLEAEVVLAVAPTLSRVLRARRDATLDSLDALAALPTLGRCIKKQQDSHIAAKVCKPVPMIDISSWLEATL